MINWLKKRKFLKAIKKCGFWTGVHIPKDLTGIDSIIITGKSKNETDGVNYGVNYPVGTCTEVIEPYDPQKGYSVIRATIGLKREAK